MPHWVMGGQAIHGHGVACLMNGGFPKILPGLHPALLRRASGDFHQSLVQILHGQHRAVFPGGQDRRLVEQIAQIRTGKAGSGASHGF